MTRSARFGLIAPPLGAALAGFGAYFAADRSCDAGHPVLARLLFVLVAVAGLGLTISGIVTSLGAWGVSARTERSDITPDQESTNAFLARAGILAGAVLTIGVSFVLLGPLMVRACERIW